MRKVSDVKSRFDLKFIDLKLEMTPEIHLECLRNVLTGGGGGGGRGVGGRKLFGLKV